MAHTRPIVEVVVRFVAQKETDPELTPAAFAAREGPLTEEEVRALDACVRAEALLEAPRSVPEPSDPLTGSVIGGYRIDHAIGRGGTGVVYAADDPALPRRIALKVLHPTFSADPTWRERFAREAEAAAHLSHPSVLPVLAAGEDQGYHYLALPLLEGESLDRAIDEVSQGRRSPFRPDDVARLGSSLADGLHHAHGRGLLHRDVKPGNVLMAAGGHPYLLDFGLARHLDRSRVTATDHVVGTPHYMAPEQLDPSLGEVDGRSDVFGLGITLCEVALGRRGFLGTGDGGASPSTALRGLPRDLATILLVAIDPDAGRRYPSAASLRDDFLRYLEGRPVQARRVGPLLRLVRWSKRRPVLAASTTVIVAILVFGVLHGREKARMRSDTVERLRADAEAALGRGDPEQALTNVRRLQALGVFVPALSERLEHLSRERAAARALDAARTRVLGTQTRRELNRARDLCNEALTFYTGRDAFEPFILKAIVSFRLRDLRGAEEAGLAAAACRQIRLGDDLIKELKALGLRLFLSGIGKESINSVSGGRGLAAIPDARLEQLRNLVVAHAADSPELMLFAGFFLDVLGQGDQACEFYDHVLDLNPRHPDALIAKTRSYLDLGKLREARDAARTAVAVAPERASCHLMLARVKRGMGRPEEALVSLERASSLDPRDPYSWLERSKILEEQGRWEDALEALDGAARLDPSAGLPVIDKADLLVKRGRWEESLEAYRAAFGKDDIKAGQARAGAARSLLELGFFEAASVAAREALAEEGLHTYGWYILSHAEQRLGNLDAAAKHALTALRVSRRFGPETLVGSYRDWSAEVERQRGSGSKTEDDLSIDVLEKLLAEDLSELRFDPENLSLRIALAARRNEAGSPEAALADLHRILTEAEAFARCPGIPVNRRALQESLADTFLSALRRLTRSTGFDDLRESPGFEELVAAWRHQVAAWR